MPAYALRLAAALWPGPLTLVVPRGPRAGDHVTGGQGTVGLRAPDHPVAQAVLADFGGGLAAPSANRFGRVSPTSASDVLAELSGALVDGLDVVLDGGVSRVGLESTILDCTGQSPSCSARAPIGPADVERAAGVPVRGPGAPSPLRCARHAGLALRTRGSGAPRGRPTVGPRAAGPPPAPGDRPPRVCSRRRTSRPRRVVVRLGAPDGDDAYARSLYRALREADALGLHTVVAVVPAGRGALATAVVDRLRRAATGSGGGVVDRPGDQGAGQGADRA